MATASIPVDLFNPGQVFACLGFLEAAEILLGDAEGGFEWEDGEARFVLAAKGGDDPLVPDIIDFVLGANVVWQSPHAGIQERDGGSTIVTAGIAASADLSPAELPALLRGSFRSQAREVPIRHWADFPTRSRFQLWTATNANSAHVRLRNVLDACNQLWAKDRDIERLFARDAFTKSLFRLDPRGDVIALDAGFGPDRQRKAGNEVRVATYPFTELFAAIGLNWARPKLLAEFRFNYSVWRAERESASLPTMLARAVVCQPLPFVETRTFVGRLSKPNDYDLSMDDVIEEPRA